MAGSYVNFLITNTSVVYPLLDCRYDEAVEDLLGTSAYWR
jgi:agmatine/peptidylarginine deiminase